MNKLFTKVATLCVGLAMAAGVGVAVGSARVSEAKADYVLAYSFVFEDASTGTASELNATSAVTFLNTAAGSSVVASASNVAKAYAAKGSGGTGVPDKVLKLGSSSNAGSLTFTLASTADEVTKAVLTAYNWPKKAVDITVNSVQRTKESATAASVDDYVFEFAATREIAMSVPADHAFCIAKIELYKTSGTPVTSYSVTDSVEHGSVSPSSVNEGAKLTATITPDTGYELPATLIDVTMGDSSVAYSYNNSTGVVEVNSVTGNIVISGSCPEKQTPQHVDLPDGEYTASFPYAKPFPTEIDVVDGQSAKVAALTSSISTVSTYDDSHSEYVIAANESIEINNLTNGKISKVDIHIFQYTNFNVYVDDATDPVYTGAGTNAGNDAHIEVPTNALSKVRITGNGGDNGSRTFKVFDVKVYIIVASAPIAVEGVSLNADEATMAVGATYNLTATITPNGADNPSVTWSSNPTSVATVSENGVVTAVAAGDAVVTVTTVDGGFTDTFTAHVVEVNYGSESSPLTVEEARAVLDVSGAATSLQKLWVYGEVYSSSYNSTYQDYTLWLKSSDGSENEYFEIYSGTVTAAITEDDTQANALAGITVICNGYGKIHNSSIYELFKSNNEKPTIAKYEAPQPATYEVSFYQGDTKLSGEEYAEGAKVTIPQPNAQLIPEGKEFDYWQHKESGDHYAPGVEFTVGSSSARFDAVYKDVEPVVTEWTQSQKDAFAEQLEGVVPPFLGEEFAGIAWDDDEEEFVISVEGDKTGTIESVFAKTEWSADENEYYTPTSHGFAVCDYAYDEENSETKVEIYFYQTKWYEEKEALFVEHLDGFVPKYHWALDYLDWYENIGQFAFLADGDATSYFVEGFVSAGLHQIVDPKTEEPVDGQYYIYTDHGTVYGITSVESNETYAYLFYVADPIPTSLSINVAGVKTEYYVGDTLDTNGLVVVVLDENGDPMFNGQNVAQYCVFDADLSAAGQVTVSISFQVTQTITLEGSYQIKVSEAPVQVYTAEDFAHDFLELVSPICSNYDGKKNNKEALKGVWTTMAQRYSILSNEEKAKVIQAAGKAGGSELERAMAFYDYACKKYGLTKFVSDRTPHALVLETTESNSIVPIIAIIAASIAAVTAIGVIIAYRRRKALISK